jgi:hypothetical protein
LIAQVISSITASLRFDGALNVVSQNAFKWKFLGQIELRGLMLYSPKIGVLTQTLLVFAKKIIIHVHNIDFKENRQFLMPISG